MACTVVMAQVPCLEFRSAGGGNSERVVGIAVDADGATYLTGTFTDNMTLGDGLLTGAEYSHFVAKVDAAEHLVWWHVFSTDMWSGPQAMALDGLGGLLITGDFQDGLDFGDFVLSHPGSTDLFVAKLNTANGNCIWLRQGEAIGYTHVRHLAVAANGDVHVGGGFWGYCTFGTTVLHCTGTMSPFVAVYDTDGTARWARQVVDGMGGTITGVAPDPTGGTFAVGSFGSTADFGDGIALTTAQTSTFLAKYDNAGHVSWARKHWPSTTGGAFRAVACNASGEPYVLHAGSPGVVKFTATGDTVWTTLWTGINFGNSIFPFGVNDDQAWVATHYTNELSIGTEQVVSANTANKLAIVELGPDGEVLGLTGYDTQGAYHVYPLAFAFDPSGFPVVGGYYSCIDEQTDTLMQLACFGPTDIFYSRPCALTATPELSGPSASLFPVPFSEQLRITLPEAACAAFELLDALGRKVWQGTACGQEIVLEPAASMPGIHLLRITYTDGTTFTLRTIRE